VWRVSAVGGGGGLSGRVGGWCVRGVFIRDRFSCSLWHHAHDSRTLILLEKTFTGGKGGGGCCQGAFIRGTMCLPKRTDAKGQMQRIEILTTYC